MNYPVQQQYPQYPQAPAPQQFPGYPQQQAAPQAPSYPPQQQYPQQGYPAPQAQPQQQLVQGTLDDFYNQPSSGGGPSLKFEQIGTRYVGIVSRPLGPGDVQHQTDTQGRPLYFKDGRPKFVMKVPLQMQPSQQYPDGTAQWYVKGAARDELTRAMAEAGAPAGPPEQGAIIDIEFVATRPSGAGMNPAKVFRVRYTPPEGGGSGQQQAQPEQAPQGAAAPSPVAAPQAPAQAPQAAPQHLTPPHAVQQFQPQGQVVNLDQAVQQAQPQVQQQPQGQPAPQPPSDLSPEQQALLSKLTGGQG